MDFLKYAARVFEDNESWAKAIQCWEMVKKLHPNDQDANRQINALSASSTIKRAKLDDALDERAAAATAAPTPETMAADLERLKHEQLSPEQRLVKDILADPKAVHAYLDLAEIYRRHSDFDKAEKVLAKGLKANAGDPGLQAVYEDTQISRLKRAIDAQSQRVLQHPEETAHKAKFDQLTEMLNKYEVEAYRRRAKVHPDDASVQLQLGKVLARIGDHDSAHRVVSAGPHQRSGFREDRSPASIRSQLRGQQRIQAGRAQLPRGTEAAGARRQGHVPGAALPAGSMCRSAEQQRSRRGALQRGRRDRLLVSRRGAAAETLDLTSAKMLCSSPAAAASSLAYRWRRSGLPFSTYCFRPGSHAQYTLCSQADATKRQAADAQSRHQKGHQDL